MVDVSIFDEGISPAPISEEKSETDAVSQPAEN